LTVRRPLFVFNSFDFYGFAAELQRVGPEGVPILKAEFGLEAPRELTRFDRWKSHPRPEVTAIHFYAQDSQLRSIANDPLRFIWRLSQFHSVICPDFSLYREMYPHQRIAHTVLNRQVGAILQRHGLRVIPNIRWSSPDDFEFCFEGVSSGSVVAISTHGCSRSFEDTVMMRQGLNALIDRIEPRVILVHGSRVPRIFADLEDRVEFRFYPPEMTLAHPRSARPVPQEELPFAAHAPAQSARDTPTC
jgi:hypothetical protein